MHCTVKHEKMGGIRNTLCFTLVRLEEFYCLNGFLARGGVSRCLQMALRDFPSSKLFTVLNKMVAGFCSMKHTTAMFNRGKDIQKTLIDNIIGMWDIKPCLLVNIYPIYEVFYCFHAQTDDHAHAEGANQFLLNLVCLMND